MSTEEEAEEQSLVNKGVPPVTPQAKERQIEPGFALAIAGQVASGLAPGDDENHRARSSLLAIGMMMQAAAVNDPRVAKQLEMVDRVKVTVYPSGWKIEST